MCEENYNKVPKDHWLYDIAKEDLEFLGEYFELRNFKDRTRRKQQKGIVRVLSEGGTEVGKLQKDYKAYKKQLKIKPKSKLQI